MTLPGHVEPWRPWPPPEDQTTEIEIQVPGVRLATFNAARDGDIWRYEVSGDPLDMTPAGWRPLALEAPSPWKASIDESMGRIKAAVLRIAEAVEQVAGSDGETAAVLESMAEDYERRADKAEQVARGLADLEGGGP